MNIMPKHEPHAMVASLDSQYWQCDESDEIAAPQLGQLRVSACISVTPQGLPQLNIPRTALNGKVLDGAGRACNSYSVVDEIGLRINEIERLGQLTNGSLTCLITMR